MLAKIYITLKDGVLDPQGAAVKHSLEALGYDQTEEIRIGKYMIMKLKDAPKKDAEAKVKEMCEKLLANPVIESYRFEIE